MRYYAQSEIVPPIFKSRHERAWMVFDRDVCTPQGDVLPILLCTNKHIALTTRDALNEYEQRK